MRTHPIAPAPQPATVAAALARHAAATPRAAALRHKLRGRWHDWSWNDVEAGSALSAKTLQGHGITQHSLVALSGPYAPGLLLAALGALRIGARIEAAPTSWDAATLTTFLRHSRPDIAVLAGREHLPVWLSARAQAGFPPVLMAETHLPWGELVQPGLVPATITPPDPGASAPRRILWVEETTDWQAGLPALTQALLDGDCTLTFPETPRAATRDRAESQPHDLLLSAAALTRLREDVAAQLPSGATGRLVAAALASARPGLLSRWLRARARRPVGLARVADVALTIPHGEALADPAWVIA